MADNSTILLNNKDDGNKIKIDLNVLEVILGIAAEKVDGVAAMQSNIRSGLSWMLGHSDKSKGVKVEVDKDGNLTADIYAYFYAGVNVPEIAAKIQKKLAKQLTQMTDLKLADINIHVVGLISPEDTQDITQPEELFSETEKEAK